MRTARSFVAFRAHEGLNRTNMKVMLHCLSFFMLIAFLLLFSCSKDDPEPTSLRFSTTSAIFNGDAINPTPVYSLEISFDGDGNPTSYTASNSSRTTPTPGASGSWSTNGAVISFTDDNGRQREVQGNVSPSSDAITLTYQLSKLDEEVITDEVGEYVYEMVAQ